MRKNFIDMTGKVFGRWRVIDRAESSGVSTGARWNCVCECGNTKSVSGALLRQGESKSCGCLHKERSKETCIERNTTHADSNSKEHMAWKGMMSRCYNKKRSTYKYYGARGIGVHISWKASYTTFLEDMGRAPNSTNEWSVGRKDNNLDYSPSNCVWEIWDSQARNRGMQENNTSGATGVYLKTARGIDQYVADWYDFKEQKRKTCMFSTKKYGKVGAYDLAVERRAKAIEDMNAQGAGYTPEHGTPRKIKES